MKKTNIDRWIALPLAVLLAVMPACSRKGGVESDGHEGHGHGAEKEVAKEADACTDHGSAGEAKPGEKKICKEHDVPLAECGICKPEGLAKLKPGESAKLRLASPESAGLVGG